MECGVSQAGNRAQSVELPKSLITADPVVRVKGPEEPSLDGRHQVELTTEVTTLPGREKFLPGKATQVYADVIHKMFQVRDDGKERCLYREELAEAAKDLNCSSEELLDKGVKELWNNPHALTAKEAPEDCKHLAALQKIIKHNVDLYVIAKEDDLSSEKLPLSPDYKSRVRRILGMGEAVALMVVKNPPEEAAMEIRKVTDEKFGGLMPLWADERFRSRVQIAPALEEFLQYATARMLTTGENPEAKAIIKELNHAMERPGEFESKHWLRVVKQVSQSEQHESLSGALKVCAPILIAVKLAEKFAPGAMHAIGGALDDLFGAVIPNVSQSMGRKDLPFWQRLKSASGVLIGGLASVPVSAAAGWGALQLYDGSHSVSAKMAAGMLFAVACCAGTAATSAVALYQAWKSIKKLEESPEFGDAIKEMSTREKLSLAFQSAILDVPFRIGHTMIGVPTQVALGAASGAFGFFHSGLFVAAEGMLETLFGAVTAYVYPYISKFKRDLALKNSTL